MSPLTLFSPAQSKDYPLNATTWQDEKGGLLDLRFTPKFDPESVDKSNFSLWRYRSALPFDASVSPVSMNEGLTPLVNVDLGAHRIQFKLDYLFPSGSYKDRGATVLMTLARQLGVSRVVQDSSGNAGCAIAHYAALAGIGCEIFVPADTSPAKLVQIRAMGAKINLIPGSREDTAQAAMKAAAQTFYASHVWQPYFFQGTKTFIYEVLEQRGWKAPDTVILPAGNGTLLLGTYLGLQELKASGVISKIPTIIGVQSAGCAPLHLAFQQSRSEPVHIDSSPTVAEGIAISVPRRGGQMLECVKESGGRFLAVDEEEIIEALRLMTGRGYFIEPTSAAVVAGVQQYLARYAAPDEDIVSVLTGHGLKSAEKINKLMNLGA